MSELNGASPDDMAELLRKQKAAQLRDGAPSLAVRADRLDRAVGALVKNRRALTDAVAADFGHRSHDTTDVADIAVSISALKHAKKNLGRWMKSERRSVEFPMGLLGGAARVDFQPKGVVGLIAPWNFPIGMVFTPLAGILAAGNRVMIKPSEFTEQTSSLMQKMFAEEFNPEEATVITGGPETGAAFTKLPFDHIIFTGAGSVAKHIMRAAAENLVPLTLELGGKSPAILGASADVEKAAKRIIAGKTMNAGQICLAPDYVLSPEDSVGNFVDASRAAVSTMFPGGLKDNDDYTSIVNQRHYDRLQGYLEDARAKGAELIELNPKSEDFSQQQHRKMPPTIVLNPSEDMDVMKDEIFGPILPVKPYRSIDDAIKHVNENDRPLGLYYFGSDQAEERHVVSSTTSGGVTINDVIFHNAQEDLPFGGIGPSGMGAYHGRDGFLEFSHKKAVYRQTGSEIIKILRPPYGDTFRKQMDSRIK